jgi:outer membrane lipoprotein-sorting protein
MVSFRPDLAVSGAQCSAEPQPQRSSLLHLVLRFVLITLAALAFATKLSAAEAPVVSAWLNAQTNIQTWTADVTQIRSFKNLVQPLTATGHVWFAAPNQFRWEIGNPAQTIAVRKSDEMLVIYPRLKRAERYSFTAQPSGPWKDTLALLEAGFPRNEADLSRQFRITNINTSNHLCQLNLEPKSASARHMMPRLTVAFSTNDFVLRTTELQFADGSTMRNEFTSPKLNPKIDPVLFAPKLDEGYKIIEPMKH